MMARLPDQMLAGAKTNLQPDVLNSVWKLAFGGRPDLPGQLAQQGATQADLARRQLGSLAPAIKLAAVAVGVIGRVGHRVP